MSTVQTTNQQSQASGSAPDWEQAAGFIEKAANIAKSGPELSYLLAMCYKRQGKMAEAQRALRKIDKPDAGVFLQLGVLSLNEGRFEEAEKDFARSLELNPHSYAAMYNLFLCWISQGQFKRCLELLSKLVGLAPQIKEKRFFALLDALICTAVIKSDEPLPMTMDDETIESQFGDSKTLLASMTSEEELAVLRLLRGVPKQETILPVFDRLIGARPNSRQLQQAYLEMALIEAKRLIERCNWSGAEQLLMPASKFLETSPDLQYAVSSSTIVAFWNLYGCCACMLQDFPRAVRSFSAAIKLIDNDARLYQNLAIAYELQNRLDQAEVHWNRYFDLLDGRVPMPRIADYLDDLAFTGMNRLAEIYNKKEKWGSALTYTQRAHRLRPQDLETLEKLFNLYVQVRRMEDARRTLRKMRELRPNDPQFDLYEMDLRDVRSLEDLDRMLADIKRILNRHPGDLRVEERAFNMVANCVPLIDRKCAQLSEQLAHIAEQVRRLPNYQINWPVVHDEMHFLRHEFQKLRRISNKCLGLVISEELRRIFKDINAQIDDKIDVCISMGG